MGNLSNVDGLNKGNNVNSQVVSKGEMRNDLVLRVGISLIVLTVLAAVAAVVCSFGFGLPLFGIVIGALSGALAVTGVVLTIVGKAKDQTTLKIPQATQATQATQEVEASGMSRGLKEITQIGQHSYTISGIPQKIHDFFESFLGILPENQPICTFGSLEYDIKNEKILGYYSTNANFKIEDPNLLERMTTVAPLFFDYLSQTVLKDRLDAGDNYAIIHFTITPFRLKIDGIHQDGVSSTDLRQIMKNSEDERNLRWKTQPKIDPLRDDALFFVYKKPNHPELPIIPTLCLEFPEGSDIYVNKMNFRKDFEASALYPLEMIEQKRDLFKLPEIDENTAWFFSNNKTLHATPHQNVVEYFRGKKIADAMVNIEEQGLSAEYASAPFLRVSVSTYYKEPT